MRMIHPRLFISVATALLLISSQSVAQYSPNCPFQGAVFPAPRNPRNSSLVISSALSSLKDKLKEIVAEPTLFDNATTSFQLNLFSKDEQLLSLSHAATTLDNTSLPSGALGENTIFRIGSVSKLLTVYALLAEIGMDHMQDPVTAWVPELANKANYKVQDAVRRVNWEDVTIGALASHQAGLDRDYSLSDLANLINATVAEQAALPPLPPDEIPTCGTTNLLLPSCSRAEFLAAIRGLHPVTSAFHTPIYSNLAFQILAYALERIAKKPFAAIFESTLVEGLGLKRTSLQPPSSTREGIVPGDAISSWWNVSLGDASPFGGILSTGADMASIGRSILGSKLLKPALTREWLRPVAHTADLHVAVGMPWEIHRLLQPLSPGSNHTRVVDLYTKNGILGGYEALFVLSPEHEFGFVLLLAGLTTPAGSAARSLALAVIGDVVTGALATAFEQAARAEAEANFGGVYANPESGMNLTISVNDGHPGLKLSNWTLSGDKDVDVLELYTGVPNAGLDARLYPMDLGGDGGAVAFRAVYEAARGPSYTSQPGVVFSLGCLPWGSVAGIQYGNVAFDDFVFEVDWKGRATAITPRVARQTLKRVK
ncbi:beta-lactamase/transpeptidase-like protein [Nemania sp. NC0429]|nr:beta-lactamase/transpeptidase-like protein [Nemania sp. NC0429]